MRPPLDRSQICHRFLNAINFYSAHFDAHWLQFANNPLGIKRASQGRRYSNELSRRLLERTGRIAEVRFDPNQCRICATELPFAQAVISEPEDHHTCSVSFLCAERTFYFQELRNLFSRGNDQYKTALRIFLQTLLVCLTVNEKPFQVKIVLKNSYLCSFLKRRWISALKVCK